MARVTGSSVDESVQLSFTGADDRAFVDARRRRRRKQPPPVPVAPGDPCCARCASWKAPQGGDPFGVCPRLVVLKERQPGGHEKGTILPVEEGMRDAFLVWEFLRTKRHFACSRYEEAA